MTTSIAGITPLIAGAVVLLGFACLSPNWLSRKPILAQDGNPSATLDASREPIPPEASKPSQATGSAAQQLADQILQRALHQAVWGPPAWCHVRQKIELYERQLSGFGTFIRAGEGSGKLKLSIQFPAGDSMKSLLQISDGQRLQSIENLGDAWKRTIIDLDEVRSRLIINDQSIFDPGVTMYLSIGGQAESLRKLAQQYEWHAVSHGKYGSIDVWLLSGRLPAGPAAIRVAAPIDQKLLQANATGLLPDSVRIAIGKADSKTQLPYWLYQVEHRRTRSPDSQSHHDAQFRLVTEWAEPQWIQNPLGDEVFEAASTNDPWFEETEDYLPPVLNVARDAARDG